jgi:hypothetical protein
MMNKGVVKKIVLALTGAVLLLSLAASAIGLDPAVDPFQKAKAMAMKEGTVTESRSGKLYTLRIEGWGVISYTEGDEDYVSLKRGILKEDVVGYYGRKNVYFIIRETDREPAFVDASEARDRANAYLHEIEWMRGK